MLTRREIGPGRIKLLALIFGASIFVALGAAFLAFAESFDRDAMLIRAVGVVSIVFFGFCGLVGLRRLISRSPVLVLDSTGFTDLHMAKSLGHIAWEDVAGTRCIDIAGNKSLGVMFHDPESIIERMGKSGGRLAAMNYRTSGTAVNLASSVMDIGFPELWHTFHDYYEAYAPTPDMTARDALR